MNYHPKSVFVLQIRTFAHNWFELLHSGTVFQPSQHSTKEVVHLMNELNFGVSIEDINRILFRAEGA
jgi:hypothetical protein